MSAQRLFAFIAFITFITFYAFITLFMVAGLVAICPARAFAMEAGLPADGEAAFAAEDVDGATGGLVDEGSGGPPGVLSDVLANGAPEDKDADSNSDSDLNSSSDEDSDSDSNSDLNSSSDEDSDLNSNSDEDSDSDSDSDADADAESNSDKDADSDEDADLIMTCDELKDWLYERRTTGGSARLGADITVDQTLRISGFSHVFEIATGDFGFCVIDDGSMTVDTSVHIKGGGARAPVISVKNGGRIVFNTTYDQMSSVIATGDGGVALSMEAGAVFRMPEPSSMLFASTGANGIAIYTEITFDNGAYDGILFGCVVEATGPGGRGIVSAVPVSLMLCRVTAGAASVEAPGIVLDTCAVYPEAPEAESFTRTLALDSSSLFTIRGMALGESWDADWVYGVFATLEAQGVAPIYERIAITLDTSLVDNAAPGIYPMPARALAPFDLAANDLDSLTVEVYDPSIPYFATSMFNFGSYSIVHFYAGEPEALTLWRSDDMGETWYEYWRGADGFSCSDNLEVDIFPDSVCLTFFGVTAELSGDVLLVFEVAALEFAGSSRILHLNIDAWLVDDGIGGDRTGVDRFPWRNTDGGATPPVDDPDPPGGGDDDPGLPGSDGDGDPNPPGGNVDDPDPPSSGDDDDPSPPSGGDGDDPTPPSGGDDDPDPPGSGDDDDLDPPNVGTKPPGDENPGPPADDGDGDDPTLPKDDDPPGGGGYLPPSYRGGGYFYASYAAGASQATIEEALAPFGGVQAEEAGQDMAHTVRDGASREAEASRGGDGAQASAGENGIGEAPAASDSGAFASPSANDDSTTASHSANDGVASASHSSNNSVASATLSANGDGASARTLEADGASTQTLDAGGASAQTLEIGGNRGASSRTLETDGNHAAANTLIRGDQSGETGAGSGHSEDGPLSAGSGHSWDDALSAAASQSGGDDESLLFEQAAPGGSGSGGSGSGGSGSGGVWPGGVASAAIDEPSALEASLRHVPPASLTDAALAFAGAIALAGAGFSLWIRRRLRRRR